MLSGVVLLSLICAPPPQAESELALIVTVIGESSDGRAYNAVELYERIVEATRFIPGLRTLSRQELLGSGGHEIERELRECALDPLCLKSRLRNADVELGVLVNLSLEAPSLLAVSLVDQPKEKVQVGTPLDLSPNDDAAQRVVDEVLSVLHGAGWSQGGRVSIRATPPDAIVTLAGQPVDANEIVLPAGEHELSVSHPDYQVQVVSVRVTAGDVQTHSVTLEPQATLTGSPWFWLALGGAAVGGGVALTLALAPGDRCVCLGPPDCQGCP